MIRLALLFGVGASQFWAQSLARSPEVERWLTEGDQRLRMGREHVREAEAAYAEAIKLDPRDLRARRDHAVALVELGRHSEAAAELRVARALDPGFDPGPLASELAVCLARVGDYAGAAQEYRRAIDARGDLDLGILHWNLGDAEMAQGRLEEARRQYQLASAAAHDSANGDLARDAPVIDLSLAVAYDRSEDPARAFAIATPQVAERALAVLGDLRSRIFFVPPLDRIYTEALANQAIGNRARALELWTEFARKGADTPWAARARDHLAELGRAPPATPPLQPAPRRRPPRAHKELDKRTGHP
jgi:tetratricopeptide (TPR) repeat protein